MGDGALPATPSAASDDGAEGSSAALTVGLSSMGAGPVERGGEEACGHADDDGGEPEKPAAELLLEVSDVRGTARGADWWCALRYGEAPERLFEFFRCE